MHTKWNLNKSNFIQVMSINARLCQMKLDDKWKYSWLAVFGEEETLGNGAFDGRWNRSNEALASNDFGFNMQALRKNLEHIVI